MAYLSSFIGIGQCQQLGIGPQISSGHPAVFCWYQALPICVAEKSVCSEALGLGRLKSKHERLVLRLGTRGSRENQAEPAPLM